MLSFGILWFGTIVVMKQFYSFNNREQIRKKCYDFKEYLNYHGSTVMTSFRM